MAERGGDGCSNVLQPTPVMTNTHMFYHAPFFSMSHQRVRKKRIRVCLHTYINLHQMMWRRGKTARSIAKEYSFYYRTSENKDLPNSCPMWVITAVKKSMRNKRMYIWQVQISMLNLVYVSVLYMYVFRYYFYFLFGQEVCIWTYVQHQTPRHGINMAGPDWFSGFMKRHPNSPTRSTEAPSCKLYPYKCGGICEIFQEDCRCYWEV